MSENPVESTSKVVYGYSSAELSRAHDYLLPAVRAELVELGHAANRRLFDLGCGNGSSSQAVADMGWEVFGVDPSVQGIAQGQAAYPRLRLEVGSAYDDLAARFGRFPVVLSLEVVEHLYDPRRFARTLFDLLEPGGTAIISTPYHGYWKNLAISITGKWDFHFTALWDHGHIKFWSMATLSTLLTEAGLTTPRFRRVGRVPALARSMVAVTRRPR